MFERVSPAYEFVRSLLALGLNPTETTATYGMLERPDLSWERIAYVASRYHVAPALFPILSRADLSTKIPADFLSYAEAIHDLNGIRNQEILEEVDALTELLNRIGIEPIFLKVVAYLLSDVYANASDRFLSDIDLLVTPPSFDEAVQQLRTHGFSEGENEPEDPFSHHHQPLSRDAGAAEVEVHRRLGTIRGDSLLPIAEIVQSSCLVVRHGVRARLPAPDHMAMHLILRSQAEEGIRAWIWPPLRALYDFGLLIHTFGSQIPWEKISRRFRAKGCDHIYQLFCRAAEECIGIERLPGVVSDTYKLRTAEAKLLRNYPKLRFADPWFMFSVMFGARVERIRVCLKTPGGLRYMTTKALSSRRLKILLADVEGGK